MGGFRITSPAGLNSFMDRILAGEPSMPVNSYGAFCTERIWRRSEHLIGFLHFRLYKVYRWHYSIK